MMSRWCRFQWPPRFSILLLLLRDGWASWREMGRGSRFLLIFLLLFFFVGIERWRPRRHVSSSSLWCATCFSQLTAANIKKEKKKQLGGISLFAATVAHNITYAAYAKFLWLFRDHCANCPSLTSMFPPHISPEIYRRNICFLNFISMGLFPFSAIFFLYFSGIIIVCKTT